MNQEMKEQESKIVEFTQNTVPVFNYSLLKFKSLKKYDKEQLSEELMNELKECLMKAVTYESKTK